MPVHYTESSDEPGRDEGADIIALGDSWFFFPENNLLEAIDRATDGRYVIQAYGANGLRIVDYLDRTLRGQWTRAVAALARRARVLLISGGGNDFAGEDDFRKLIRDDCSPAGALDTCWRPGQPALLFDDVERGYEEIITAARRAGCRGTVVLHAYDYAVPTGQGFNRFIGGWLKKPLDTSHVPIPLQQPLVKALVDELEDRLRGLAETGPDIAFVDSTGVLRAGEWHDELHPTRAGFDRLARECWVPVLEPLLRAPLPAPPVAFGVPTPAVRAAKPKRARAPVKKAPAKKPVAKKKLMPKKKPAAKKKSARVRAKSTPAKSKTRTAAKRRR